MDTETLVKSARQGDREALLELILAQKQDYYKLAYVYMQNEEEALDAMEDMILLLYENIHRLKKDEAFYSWSKTILVNCCKKILRRRKKIFYIDNIETPTHEDLFAVKNEQIVLQKHLSQLSPKQQEVLKLRYYLDLDYQSIAEITGIPLGTVKSRIFTGLKKLKESLGGEIDAGR